MLPQFSYSSAEVRRVRQVQFGVLSPEEIVSSFAESPEELSLFRLEVAVARPLAAEADCWRYSDGAASHQHISIAESDVRR